MSYIVRNLLEHGKEFKSKFLTGRGPGKLLIWIVYNYPIGQPAVWGLWISIGRETPWYDV